MGAAAVIVDTSIWVDHLGSADPLMIAMLDTERVLMHEFVLGEIAMGALRDRTGKLSQLRLLPFAVLAEPFETVEAVERHKLFGTGIGYVDAHLLTSTLLMPGIKLWTRDKRLRAAAERLGVAATGDD